MPVYEDAHAKEASGTFNVKLGGVYNFLVQKSLDDVAGNETVIADNSMLLCVLLPQDCCS